MWVCIDKVDSTGMLKTFYPNILKHQIMKKILIHALETLIL